MLVVHLVCALLIGLAAAVVFALARSHWGVIVVAYVAFGDVGLVASVALALFVGARAERDREA